MVLPIAGFNALSPYQRLRDISLYRQYHYAKRLRNINDAVFQVSLDDTIHSPTRRTQIERQAC